MQLKDAIISRKSVRAFLQKEVNKEDIIDILNLAKESPSGVNMQPWEVYVVQGAKKKSIEKELQEAFLEQKQELMDYNYYPLNWNEPFKSRRKQTGLLMYETLKISKDDKELQKQQWQRNYRAFDAPVVLYFFIDKSLEKGSYLDYGMFLQTLMLAAQDLGLATCTQAALAEYPSIVKKHLQIDESKDMICGMALGYEDKGALVNSFKTSRVDLDQFVKFIN